MPFGPRRGRIPVAELARAAAKSHAYTNINLANSNVGIINTGDLAKIDAAITITIGKDSEEFGARLKDVTDAILKDQAITADLKKQMIEVVQAISGEAVGKRSPSKPVLSALFDKLKDMAANFTLASEAAEKLKAAWDALQGVS